MNFRLTYTASSGSIQIVKRFELERRLNNGF
nr:MAG TPA: hypothetical protein [Bacteriophage sp.]